jgi:hypothetical protein
MPPGGSFWYQAGNTYGDPNGQNWWTTPLGRDFLSPTIPQGEYTAYLANNNLGGFDRRSQFAQGLYGKSQSGYQAALLNYPGLSYRDYLNTHLGNMNTLYDQATPEQRGEGGVARNFSGRARLFGRG